MNEFWDQAVVQPLRDLGQQAVASLSSLMGMMLLLLLGLAIGALAREIVVRVLQLVRFDRLCQRLGVAVEVERLGLARSCSHLAGKFVQGIIVVTALLAGLVALRTPWTQNLVERFFLYLPHLVAAVFILVAGLFVSRFLGRSVLIAAVNANLPPARFLAGLTQASVMALAVVASLDELGIGRTTIIVAFAILFGGLVTAAAIAFGLGAKDLARDLLQSRFRPAPKTEDEKIPISHL